MKGNLSLEIVVSVILLILLGLLLNPLGLWMPSNLHMMIVIVLLIIFTVFAGFILRENAKDEREGLHRMMADRIAFLVGAGILVIGIIVQSFQNTLNLWLVLALSIMIFAKIIGLIYSRLKH